jgi:hypothetical protein
MIVFSIDLADSFFYHSGMLEDATYFTIFARWPDEIRLLSIEWEMIETEAEALAALRQNERAVLVLRSDPDCPRRDVSEDIARAWLDELLAAGFDPGQDRLPSFIREYLTEDDIETNRPATGRQIKAP